VRVSKAHACGNDFLVVNDKAARGHNYAELARALCSRTTSVGADGVEFLTETGQHEGRIVLHNADGSVAEISGNGTRCVAAWIAHERGLGSGDTILLRTDAGERRCYIERRDGWVFQITSGMGTPLIERRRLQLPDGLSIDGAVVSTGNPHFVVFTDDAEFAIAGRGWEEIGREICFHPDFPRQTNVEFVRTLAPDRIGIRIFERGVGPTSSSGTGTSAAAAAAIALRGTARSLSVQAPGGEQRVEWDGGCTELRLTGPAQIIMTADVFLEEGEAK
jgi:diaminopimelate epimerase